MGRAILASEFIGRKYGRLTVKEQLPPDKHKKIHWRCECECGGTATPSTRALTTGNTTSCGCLKKELLGDRSRTHGSSRSGAYRSWCAMKDRCYRETNQDYPLYGGRGIKVCDRWLHSFENFLADMGERPYVRATIERLDTNGNYEPDNCEWATQKTQTRNKRNSHNLTIDGETKSIGEWAELYGIDSRLIWKRVVNLGWSAEDAVKKPRQTTWDRHPAK